MNNNIQPNAGQTYGGTSPGQVPPSPRRMHPLMTTAAVAVIIASLTAVAAITGVLPTSKATQGSTDPNVAAQSTTAAPGASTTPMALAAPGQTTQPNQAAPYPLRPWPRRRRRHTSRPMPNALHRRHPATHRRHRVRPPARIPVT